MKNISELLSSIKMDLGILGLNLPVTDEQLLQVIKLKSLKTFSIYFPRKFDLDLDLRTLNRIKYNFEESVYELPDVFGDSRIISIRDVKQKFNYMGGAYYPASNYFDGVGIYQDLMLGQLDADLVSSAMPPFTFKFEEPNLLYVYNMASEMGQVTVEVQLTHFDNLSSIKNTLFDSFEDLALLDMKKYLYNILKNYSNIETAYGNINLNIDDWSNAEGDRKELLAKWDDLYHIDTANQFVIV